MADGNTPLEAPPTNQPPVGEMVKGGPDWRVPGGEDAKIIEQQNKANQPPQSESTAPKDLSGIDSKKLAEANEKVDADMNTIRDRLNAEGKNPQDPTPQTPTSPPTAATEQKTGISGFINRFKPGPKKPH